MPRLLLGRMVADQQLPVRLAARSLGVLGVLAARPGRLVGRVRGARRPPMTRPRPWQTPSTARQAARAGLVRQVADKLARDLGREPTDAEVAALLARSPDAIARLRRLRP